MKWSENTWNQMIPTYEKITKHPFIEELSNGSLPQEKFEYYIQQDAYYLADFGKVLAGIGTKLEKPAHVEAFLSFATNTIQVEQILHSSYLQQFNFNKDVPISPSCLLYVGFLNKIFNLSTIEETLAAVLPCFWIYKKVGDYILKIQTTSENPYQNWIATYAGEEFGIAVKNAIEICDYYADKSTTETRKKMTDAFLMASKMEWLFWDSAYNLESWKI
ncbi:thiaminase II [Cellulophaga baltica]|uniref:thiaminase II n=1 Tax=Cellulophaga TaxID=104264 RepID=UPI001C06F09B|nr:MULTISPECIES: thiaminase II [Cellulophaga]MBU2995712.1 thiaminase II [Cellulophaga baltica]MDO6767106.1 thiaminase II [Cellulophaga sp. 1_MG-2023]